MKHIKDKKVDQFIAEELMKEIGIDEKRMLSRLEFAETPKKQPIYKKPIFYIPTIACMLLILMTVVSLLSITIYKSTNESQYRDNDIVYEALDVFEDEVDDFKKLERIALYQVNNELLCTIYYSKKENKYYSICYFKIIDIEVYSFKLNGNEYSLSIKVEIDEISLQDVNEFTVYENDVEIFKTTFTKPATLE